MLNYIRHCVIGVEQSQKQLEWLNSQNWAFELSFVSHVLPVAEQYSVGSFVLMIMLLHAAYSIDCFMFF